MKNYKHLFIFFLLIFTGGAVFHSLQKTSPGITSQTKQRYKPSQRETAALKAVWPDADAFSEKIPIPPHYKVFTIDQKTGQKNLIGIAFLTTDIVPQETGYSGPIQLMVGVDLKGTLTRVFVLEHSETNSYVKDLRRFTEQFSSKNINDPFQLGEDLDGISMATITSEGIARSLRESLKIISKEVLELQESRPQEKARSLAFGQILIPLLIFLLAVLAFIFNKNFLRWTSLLSGLFYFGIIRNTMFSVIQIVNIGLLRIPSFWDSPLWYMLLGLSTLTCLLWGMVYCGSICPFAALQEIFYFIFKKIPHQKKVIPKRIDNFARYLKYIILLSILILSFFFGNSNVANIEPYVLLFSAHTTKLGWAFVILMLLVSAFHFRFWCKYFCPIGAYNGLLTNISLFKIQINKETCNNCEHCIEICPTSAIKKDNSNQYFIDYPECILCGKCLKECPQKALTLRRRSHEQTS